MAVTKSRSAHPLGRLKLPQKGVVFSEKRYADSSVNLLFNKMRTRTPPFHGVLVAEAEARRFYLAIVDNEPYAAGEEQQGIFVPMTLHGFFSGLRKLPAAGAGLTLIGTDPLFLKALLTMIQCVPTTEGSTEIMEIDSVVEHVKKSSQDQLLVVGHSGDLSMFYFRESQPIAGYFADPEFEKGEDSLEERLLAYVYKYSGQASLSIHVFASMAALPADDGVFERGEWPEALVEYFTKPIPSLLVMGADGGARRFELAGSSASLGRGEDNDIVIEDPAISRRHLIFRREVDGVTVEDCGSRNGTVFNGAQLKKAMLTHGAELHIGECLIRFLGSASQAEPNREVDSGEETLCKPSPEFAAPHPQAVAEDAAEPAVEAVEPQSTHRESAWTLEVVRPDGSHNRVPLKTALTTIGRAKADLVIVDTKVSRRHGELEVGPAGVTYRDTGSTNGSLLNGRAVTSALLKVGDVLKLGETSLTVFRDAA